MAQKPDTRLTVRLDETVLETLGVLSKKRRISLSELVRGYVERGLTRDEQPEHYRELEQLLERVIDRTVVARIERHISLTVKGIIASAAGYFLTARVMESMVPPECQEDYRDALAEARRRDPYHPSGRSGIQVFGLPAAQSTRGAILRFRLRRES